MQYSLDIETLVLFLSNRHQSGEITTNLKRLHGSAYKGPCRARITLLSGKIASCTIQDLDGKNLATGEVALSELQKMGKLDWKWTPQQAHVPFIQQSPPDASSLVPKQLPSLEKMDIHTLSRKHLQVLFLVDGSRTVAHIAALLTSPPSLLDQEEIGRILKDLQQRRIIEIDSN